MLRRSLAVALLFVHSAAAAHLALATHVTGEKGVIDAPPSCPQPGHGFAGIAHGHELDREETECQAVALARTAAFASTPACALPVVAPRCRLDLGGAEACPPL